MTRWLSDPAFWALIAGFGLILSGFSPLFRDEYPTIKAAEHGCRAIFAGIAVVLIVTVIKLVS